MRSFAAALVLFAAVTPGVRAATPVPAMRNYEVRIVGTVRAVDRSRRLVTIAYAPLETAPGGVRPLRLADRRALAKLSVGEAVSGIADTRHSPWNLRDVRGLP